MKDFYIDGNFEFTFICYLSVIFLDFVMAIEFFVTLLLESVYYLILPLDLYFYLLLLSMIFLLNYLEKLRIFYSSLDKFSSLLRACLIITSLFNKFGFFTAKGFIALLLLSSLFAILGE